MTPRRDNRDDGEDITEEVPRPRPGDAAWSSTRWPDSAGRPPRRPNPRPQPAPPTTIYHTLDHTTPWTSAGSEMPSSPSPVPPPLTTAAASVNDPTRASDEPTATEAQVSPAVTVRRHMTRARAVMGVDGLSSDFSFRHLFGNSLHRRSQDEVEQELMVGTARTTPPLSAVDARWPQPWLFARAFLATAAVFLLLFVGWTLFEPQTLLPGLIIVGSLAMPITALIFFFEMNLPRNVSIVAVLRLVFLGGAGSLLFSLFGFELLDFAWLAVVAAPVMEVAKLVVVVLMARQARHRHLLNGMLFGAAVGAGVAAFEAAGYALVAALFTLDTAAVIDAIVVRGMFSPFTHVVWTAMAAGGLWRVRGAADRLRFEHLRNPRFWSIMMLVIALHAVWISPIPNPLYLKSLVLGLVAWPVCLSLLQEGITEIGDRQQAAA